MQAEDIVGTQHIEHGMQLAAIWRQKEKLLPKPL